MILNGHPEQVLRCLGFWRACIGVPAVAVEPLYVKNLSPVAGLLGLPSQRDADTAAAGSLSAALHSIASHYVLDSSTDEYLNLDGETLRVRTGSALWPG